MIEFTCRTAAIGPIDIPDLVLDGDSIPEYLNSNSNGDISLVIEPSNSGSFAGHPRGVYSIDLHLALAALTRNRRNETRVRRIGLLFAGRYEPFPEALGIMFDRGFRTDDDPHGGDASYELPREGCAVFLDRIAELPRQGEALRDEVTYTALHELGHVFNLVHSSDGTHFMRGSARSAVRPREFFRYSDTDRAWLGSCSVSSAVRPGGIPFRDGAANSVIAPQEKIDEVRPELTIKVSQEVAAAIDPVELDVDLRTAPHAEAPFEMPHEVDPGYSRFRIWIRDPSREVRLFRSPRHYCPSGKMLVLRPGESFQRDIGLFGQSGGYTFRRPGRHEIWAELDLPSGATVKSNVESLEVVLPKANEETRFLSRGRVARILYYRRASPRSRTLRDLAELSEQCTRPIAGTLLTTLGRVMASQIPDLTPGPRQRIAREARDFLLRGIDHPQGSTHAQRRASAALQEVEQVLQSGEGSD